MTINTTTDSVITPWVQYTPTITGFGTPTNVSFWSRRLDNCLEVRGKFTSGTSTGVEAQVTLGYAGTNANVSSSATIITTIQICGPAIISYAAVVAANMLIESNVGYLTFGFHTAGRDGLTKLAGSTMLAAADICSFSAVIPVTTWP